MTITIPKLSPSALDGKKTVISIAIYVLYHLAMAHKLIQANPDVETLLLGCIGAGAAHKGQKILDALNEPEIGPQTQGGASGKLV